METILVKFVSAPDIFLKSDGPDRCFTSKMDGRDAKLLAEAANDRKPRHIQFRGGVIGSLDLDAIVTKVQSTDEYGDFAPLRDGTETYITCDLLVLDPSIPA